MREPMRRLLCLVLCAVLLSGLVVCAGAAETDADIIRISGKNRVQTAIQVADQMKAVLGVQKFQAIIIASGSDPADALAGSYLAAVKKAPILLIRGNASRQQNLEYVAANLDPNGIVYLLGGSSAVPQEMEDLLIRNGINCKRLAGKARFATNLEVLKEAGITGEEILVATGWNFADSLGASASGKPILLVNQTTGKLTAAQKEYLSSLGKKKFTIIGGTGAVSDDLAQALSAYGEVTRLSGKGREATSVEVAKAFFQNPDAVFLAYSRDFPDGLCGGPLACVMGAPLLLVNKDKGVEAAEYVAANSIRKGFVLGGTSVVTQKSVDLIFPAPEVKQYTVTFLDYDGTVLKTQVVEEGQSAQAPADPTREGHLFTGWDKSFENVTADLTVTAQYQKITDPMIQVGSAKAAPGDTGVKVAVSVINNPGMLGMTLKLSYNETAMIIKRAENGAAAKALTMTPPGKFVNGCNFVWDAMELAPEEILDGEILVLTVDIPQTAEPGMYDIEVSYKMGDIFDGDWNDLELVLGKGRLQIS